MAKSMTVGKRENEKKRLAKREAKLKRKEGRKSTKSSFDDMIATRQSGTSFIII